MFAVWHAAFCESKKREFPIVWDKQAVRLECCMAKQQEAVDNLLDALMWMRRKAKKREPVDGLIDELVKMRRKAKKKTTKKDNKKKSVKARKQKKQ